MKVANIEDGYGEACNVAETSDETNKQLGSCLHFTRTAHSAGSEPRESRDLLHALQPSPPNASRNTSSSSPSMPASHITNDRKREDAPQREQHTTRCAGQHEAGTKFPRCSNQPEMKIMRTKRGSPGHSPASSFQYPLLPERCYGLPIQCHLRPGQKHYFTTRSPRALQIRSQPMFWEPS